jgi:predicted nucleic acid-binding protein
MVDCLVASVALRNGATLLAQDGDLSGVAKVVGIALDQTSLAV